MLRMTRIVASPWVSILAAALVLGGLATARPWGEPHPAASSDRPGPDAMRRAQDRWRERRRQDGGLIEPRSGERLGPSPDAMIEAARLRGEAMPPDVIE